jgi:hypothetical protein
LASYEQQVQRLLNDEANKYFNLNDLIVYINLGRNDIARQTGCLIANGTLATVSGTQQYPISGLTPPSGGGLATPVAVRNLRSLTAGKSVRLEGRSWEWFSNYYLDGLNSMQAGAVPTLWAQQTQGTSGIIWVWPIPNAVASVIVDASWLPIPLVDDSTIEALPYPWTDCVPYFAAYMALVQAQRLQDAQGLYALYGKFSQSARLGVTPNWLAVNFPTLTPLPSNVDVTATLGGQNVKPAQRGEGTL